MSQSSQNEGIEITVSTTNNAAGVTTTISTATAAIAPTATGTPIKSRNPNRMDKQQQEDKTDAVLTIKGKAPPKPPEEFYRDLQQFHEKRGTPIRSIPRITGNEVDLHRLYCEVTERGGFQKVNMRDEWDDVLPELGWKEKIVNASAGLKYIYRRFLEKYERLNFFGEDPDKIDAIDGTDIAEIMGSSASGRSNRGTSRYPSSVFGSSAAAAAAIHNVAMTYNYKQHHVNMEKRRHFKLSTDLHKASPYEKLMLSLLSPLPNEQDFAINSCTLMANECKHTLKINEYPKLLDALLAHTGVFSDYTMRRLFQHVYSGVRRHSLYGFWYDLLNDRPQILDLYTDEQAIREAGLLDDWDDGKNYIEEGIWSDSKELGFLNLGRGLGTQDYVGQRVLQVVSIIRNVSFFEENLPALVKNRTLLRFLVMSSNIRWSNVHILALEITGNIAGELELLDPSIDDLSRCFMASICDGIEGPDRGVIINCLEILYKLCQRDTNQEHVLKCLPEKFYNTIALFLSLNDIMLLLFTLEAIYALTCLGSKSCYAMLQVRGIIDQLVSLISVEAQSYGPDGCILMRVVETVPGNMLPLVAKIANLQNVAAIQKSSSQHFVQPPAQTKPQTVPSFPLMAPEMVEGPPAPPAVLATQAVEHSQPQIQPQNFTHEDEQYALAWLGATFERTTNSECFVEQQELYRMYLSHCQKSGKHSVVNHVHFPRLVRLIFTNSVGPSIVRKVDGADLPGLHYISIRIRAHTLPLQPKVATAPNTNGSKNSDNSLNVRKLKKRQKNMDCCIPPANTHSESNPTAVDIVESVKIESAALNNPLTTADKKSSLEAVKSPLYNVESKKDEKIEVLETEENIMTRESASDAVLEGPTLESSPTVQGSQSQSTQTSLIKSLLANKVTQRQQKQRDITATGTQAATIQTGMSHAAHQPLKVPSTAISALVNNPLMQNAAVKVGQTTIKPLNPQISLEKKQIISESTPPPLAPLSGANVTKDASGRPLIIANQMLVDILDKKFTDSSTSSSIIQKRKIDEIQMQNKRIAIDSPTPCAFKQDTPVMPSKNAANLYAEMAASILEDEDLEEFSTQSTNVPNQYSLIEQQPMQQQQQQHSLMVSSKVQSSGNTLPTLQNMQRQLVFQANQQPQLKLTQTSAGTTAQQIPNAMATIKTDQGLQTVPVILHQKPLDASQSQTQLLQQVIQQTPSPQTQYVLATNQQGQTYLVAQQTQPQPQPSAQQPTQTVLVTQTPQQQSTGAKTIIILQQQPMQGTTASHQILASSTSGQPQKMIMTTSQGQQVLVTQRPQTPQQIFINQQTGAASQLQSRQIIQTSSTPGSAQQQVGPQLQAGQISPSLLNQLNQIPATIKLHQPIPQPPPTARISMTKGGGVSIVQGPSLQPSQTTPVSIPQLQQHQSIIQQHIISGPSEKRHVILGGGRAIEIKETLITQAQPPPQQSQLNSQTIITTQQQVAPTLQQQSQQQQQVQLQLRSVLEQQQFRSIIQQKVSTFSTTSPQQILQQAPQTKRSPYVQDPLSTATTTAQTPVLLARKVSEVVPTLIQTKFSAATQQMQPSLPTVILPGGSPNISGSNKSLLTGTPPLVKPSLPTVKLPPAITNVGPPPLTTVNNTTAIATSTSAQTSQSNQSEKGNNKKEENAKAVAISTTPSNYLQNNVPMTSTTSGASLTASTQGSISTSSNNVANATATAPAQHTSQQQTSMTAVTPQVPPPQPPQLSATDAQWLYICDWRNCPRKKFKSPSDLQHHVCTSHAPDHLDPSAEIFCQWGVGPALCDGIPRKRFSLMTHLLDRHLIPDALRAAVQRRITTGMHNIAPTKPPVTIVRNIELSQRTNSESPSPLASSSSSSQTTATIGSSAMQAIKRHTADYMNSKELMDENEGPVTKSIRLTAALILRNLVIYTTTAKRSIRRYEPHLSNIAFSNVESSGTISHILHEINN